ncbi:dynamin family protein, partial [Colletotrichum plurivorum]
ARADREALVGFYQNIIPGDYSRLAAAIKQASRHIIGSSNSKKSRKGDSFSDDHIYRSPEQTDKKVVDEMVRGYSREKRNALLLVVTARIHEAIQRAPDEVGNADASGTRTLGAITNLDAAYNEREVLARLANRGSWNPRYGWHCLRNLGGEERMNGADRDALEATYFGENWTHVDETSKGIRHLRPKLSKFLASQLRVHLPELVSEVIGRIGVIKGQLEMLRKRTTSEREQRDYLSRIALDFQHLCCNTVNGQYGEGTGPPHLQAFFNNQNDSRNKQHDKRLQAVVRAMGQLFNSTMITNGKSTELTEVDVETRSPSARFGRRLRRST